MAGRRFARAVVAVALLVGAPARGQAPPPAPARPDTGSVAGIVRDDLARPVEGARVRDDLTGRVSLSGADGRFHLAGLPAGPRPFEVTALGFAAAAGTVEVRAGARAELAVTLARLARLDSVVVTAEAPSEAPREFLERAREGLAARVFTAEEIARRRPVYTSELLRLVPGVRVTGIGPNARVLPGRGSSTACARTYLDGYPVQQGEVNVVPPSALSGIEFYYALQAPPQYARGAPCAVVLLWTKHQVPLPHAGPALSYTAPAGAGALACARRAVVALGYTPVQGDSASGPVTLERRRAAGTARRAAAVLPGVGRGRVGDAITVGVANDLLKVEVVGHDERGAAVKPSGEAADHAKRALAACAGA